MDTDAILPEVTEEERNAHKEECEREIDLCHETINKNQEDYDKQLLTLASGFLAVVIAFVKDVVPLKSAVHVGLFYGTASLLVLCVLCVLFSYQLSIAGHYRAKSFWENKKPGDDNSKFPYRIAERVRLVNIISGVLFFAATILLVLFIILNVVKERNMNESSDPIKSYLTQDGSNPKKPAQIPTSGGFDRGSHLKVPVGPAPSSAQPSQTGSGTTNSGK